LPEGAQTALLRQMVLIDADGRLRASRLTESLELRVYHKNDLGHPFAFKLRRADLFAARNGGLRAVSDEEKAYFDFQVSGPMFVVGVDPFEVERKERRATPALMSTCGSCHARVQGNGIHSVNAVFAGSPARAGLVVTDLKEQANATLNWHRQTYTWGLLQGLWGSPKE
jgi:hypothetical protein